MMKKASLNLRPLEIYINVIHADYSLGIPIFQKQDWKKHTVNLLRIIGITPISDMILIKLLVLLIDTIQAETFWISGVSGEIY